MNPMKAPKLAPHVWVFAVLLILLGVAAVLVTGCSSHKQMSSVGGVMGAIGGGGLRQAGQHPLGEAAVPGSEELWVIARTKTSASPLERPADQPKVAQPEPEVPGTGALLARLPDAPKPVPVPLKHTDVRAAVAGYIATVDVTQQYHNPYDGKIEAIYVFPLPENAAVTGFLMTVGDRKIRGIIREREEAKRIYEEAKHQGYVASLLTQERPNVFTQAVANIEPGKQIDVSITYFHSLSYVDGWYEFVFPMVVGPRFNPPGTTDGIGAVGRAAGSGQRAGKTGQATEVSYLRPEERSGHDISLQVSIDAGVPIERIETRTHRVTQQTSDRGGLTVALAPDDRIPNKDFVLRYKVAGDKVKAGVIVQRDAKDPTAGYFTLMLFPPESMRDLPRQPLEMVFTLDVSGSMSGQPIEQSKAAIRYALQHMRPDDTFQVIRFAGSAESMSERPLPATRDNVRKALRYIQSMEAGGGTMMIEGIRQSLQFPRDESRLRFVAFLTDGYIGNEQEILREIRTGRGDSRIFSFGVGSSTNRYLLDGMGRLGRGAVAYLGLKDRADEVMASYFQRISHPALTDLQLDFGAAAVSEVYPSKPPDLFVGRPVVITGRFKGELPPQVRVSGRAGGERRELLVGTGAAESAHHRGIAAVWARAKLADLADEALLLGSPDAAPRIREVALEYGLMSAYTAFVAVDSSAPTVGDHGTTVAVPVPVPEGVRYETTVSE